MTDSSQKTSLELAHQWAHAPPDVDEDRELRQLLLRKVRQKHERYVRRRSYVRTAAWSCGAAACAFAAGYLVALIRLEPPAAGPELMVQAECAAGSSTSEMSSATPAASMSRDLNGDRDSRAAEEHRPMRPLSPEPVAPLPRASWRSQVAAGNFAEVVTDAEKMGMSTCLSSCGVEELAALGDAARYTGRRDLAERALLTLRNRFPAAAESRRGAFLLGRTREQQGNMHEADEWFARYLSEEPGGSHAAEALAGRMKAARALKQTAAAQALARQYLDRYPDGVERRTAERLLEAP